MCFLFWNLFISFVHFLLCLLVLFKSQVDLWNSLSIRIISLLCVIWIANTVFSLDCILILLMVVFAMIASTESNLLDFPSLAFPSLPPPLLPSFWVYYTWEVLPHSETKTKTAHYCASEMAGSYGTRKSVSLNLTNNRTSGMNNRDKRNFSL